MRGRVIFQGFMGQRYTVPGNYRPIGAMPGRTAGRLELGFMGGQAVQIVVRNANPLGTSVTIDHLETVQLPHHALVRWLGGQQTTTRETSTICSILPMADTVVQYATFGNPPMGWRFRFSWSGSAHVATYHVYSTSRQGQPTWRNVP